MTWTLNFRDQVLARMALLHSEFMGRKESVNFKKKPGSIITYVYDTDVIRAYTLPWDTGPENTKGWGYGQLLPKAKTIDPDKSALEQRQHEDGNAWQTARILSETALKAHTEGERSHDGIVMFDQHLGEVRVHEKGYRDSIPTALSQTRAFMGKDDFRQQTENTLDRLGGAKTPEEDILTYASRRMEASFLENYDGRPSAQRAVENFDILNKEFGSFVSFSEVEKSLPKFEDNPNFLEVEAFARKVLTKLWTLRLSKSKPGRSKTRNFQNDIEVLVDLAVINRRLLEASISHRIVFVTGDSNLVKSTYFVEHDELRNVVQLVFNEANSGVHLDYAAQARNKAMERKLETYFFNCNFDSQQEFANKDWISNFSYHYVRHFWAVAGEALIETSDTSAFQDLFHGLFARRGNWVRDSRRSVEKLVLRGPASMYEQEFEDFEPEECLIRWNELTASRIRDARAKEFGIDRELTIEFGKKPTDDDASGKKSRSLVSMLVEYSNRRRDRVMLALSDLGAKDVLQSVNSGGEYQDLYFVSLPNTIKLLQNLCVPGYYSSEAVYKFLDDFNALKDDCFGFDLDVEYDDRQLSHLKFLILAIIFASSDKWEAAFGHARRAQNIVDRSEDKIPVKPNSGSNMSGRESQFMLSICLRKRAVKLNDFDDALSCLSKAHEALENDLKVNPNINKEFHSARFLNEELAIYLGKYYFLRSLDPCGDKASFSESVGAVYDLLQKGRPVFQKLISDYLSEIHYETNAPPPLTVDFAALNILQVLTISVFRDESFLKAPDAAAINQLCSDALRWLNLRNSSPEYSESAKTTIYRLVAAALMEESEFPTFESSDHLEKSFSRLLNSVGSSSADLPQYELWRRDALKTFAKSLI